MKYFITLLLATLPLSAFAQGPTYRGNFIGNGLGTTNVGSLSSNGVFQVTNTLPVLSGIYPVSVTRSGTNLFVSITNAVNEWITPEQYGAATDGTTDCGVAFTNALAYVSANRGVGLQLGCTNGYHFNQPLYVPDTVTISGRNYVREGGNVALRTPDMMFDQSGLIISNRSGVRLLNLAIRGTTAATGGLTNGANGVTFISSETLSAVAFLYIDNCTIYRFGGAGIYLTNTDEVVVRESNISDNQDGVVIGPYSANTLLESLNMGGGLGTVSAGTYNRTCLNVDGGRPVTVIGGDWGNTTNSVVKLSGGSRVLITGANIENNTGSTSPIILANQSYLDLRNTYIVRGSSAAAVSNYNSSIYIEVCNLSTVAATPDISSGSDPIDTIISPNFYTFTNWLHTSTFAASTWPVDYGSGLTYTRGTLRMDRSDPTTDNLLWRAVLRGTSYDVPFNYYYLQWWVDKSYSDPAMSLTVGPLVANGAGVTNMSVTNLKFDNLQTTPFTNNVAARIAILGTNGVTYYLTLSTNGP